MPPSACRFSPGWPSACTQGDVAAEVIQPAIEPGLFVMAAGQLRGSPARAYDSPALPQLLKEVSHDFELAVFDLPTAGQASCTHRLAGLLDGVLLVVESERVYWEAAQRVKELFARTGASLLGVVLNKQREQRTPLDAEQTIEDRYVSREVVAPQAGGTTLPRASLHKGVSQDSPARACPDRSLRRRVLAAGVRREELAPAGRPSSGWPNRFAAGCGSPTRPVGSTIATSGSSCRARRVGERGPWPTAFA